MIAFFNQCTPPKKFVRFGGLVAVTKQITNFDVLLTVHLSIILVINQLNAQFFVL